MDIDKVRGLSLLLAGVSIVLMIISAITQSVGLVIAACVVCVIECIVAVKFWRCPTCGKPLGPLWVKYCPHCGEWLV